MSTPSEAIKAVNSVLGPLIEQLEAIDSAEERRQGFEILTAQATSDYAVTRDRLEALRAELGKVEDDLKSKSYILDDQRARAIKDNQDRIAAQQARLDDLNKQVADAQHRHDELIASMQALRKRLGV